MIGRKAFLGRARCVERLLDRRLECDHRCRVLIRPQFGLTSTVLRRDHAGAVGRRAGAATGTSNRDPRAPPMQACPQGRWHVYGRWGWARHHLVRPVPVLRVRHRAYAADPTHRLQGRATRAADQPTPWTEYTIAAISATALRTSGLLPLQAQDSWSRTMRSEMLAAMAKMASRVREAPPTRFSSPSHDSA